MKQSKNSQKAEADAVREAMAIIVFALASLAETRDSDTGKHILRIQHYVRTLAQRLQGHPRFEAQLTDAFIGQLLAAVPLYDMGTIGIPDRILLKPGRLNAAEFAIMKTHTTLARNAIEQAEATLGYQTDLL